MTNNKQQTAVEWFFEKLKNHQIQAEHFEFYQQAKEMEEQQKIEFANWCRIHDNKYKNEVWMINQLFDKYKNENYGGAK